MKRNAVIGAVIMVLLVGLFVIIDPGERVDSAYIDGINIYDIRYSYTMHIGQVTYDVLVEHHNDTDTLYDYYTVYLTEIVNPSINSRDGFAWITQAITLLNLTDEHQMIVDSLPDNVHADITIDTDTDANWGGYAKWTLTMTGDARESTVRFYTTTLLRVDEGFGVSINVTLNISFVWFLPPNFYVRYYTRINIPFDIELEG